MLQNVFFGGEKKYFIQAPSSPAAHEWGLRLSGKAMLDAEGSGCRSGPQFGALMRLPTVAREWMGWVKTSRSTFDRHQLKRRTFSPEDFLTQASSDEQSMRPGSPGDKDKSFLGSHDTWASTLRTLSSACQPTLLLGNAFLFLISHLDS